MGIYCAYLLQPHIQPDNPVHEEGTIPTVSTVTPVATISNTLTPIPAVTVKPSGFTLSTVLAAMIVLSLL